MAFDETFSFWPRVGVSYYNRKVTTPEQKQGTTTTPEPSTKWSGFDITAEANLGISPFSNFAFLVGPFLEFPLSGTRTDDNGTKSTDTDSKLTSFGLSASVVGYFGE